MSQRSSDHLSESLARSRRLSAPAPVATEGPRCVRLVAVWCVCAALIALGTLSHPAIALADEALKPDGHRWGRIEQPIIGGTLAQAEQLYATVAFVTRSDSTLLCTGTLIAKRVVLTAAHCFYGASIRDPVETVDSVEVVAGTRQLGRAETSQHHRIEKIVGHPQYGGQTDEGDDGLGNDSDIAIVILRTEVTEIAPVHVLPSSLASGVFKTGQLFTISGFGTTDALGETDVGMLYVADTPLTKQTAYEFVLGGTDKPDTCPGDSGGPAYVVVDGTRFVAGVTSRGLLSNQVDCGEGGISTNASAFLAWIVNESNGLYVPHPLAGDLEPTKTAKSSSGCHAAPGDGPAGWPFWLGLIVLLGWVVWKKHAGDVKSF